MHSTYTMPPDGLLFYKRRLQPCKLEVTIVSDYIRGLLQNYTKRKNIKKTILHRLNPEQILNITPLEEPLPAKWGARLKPKEDPPILPFPVLIIETTSINILFVRLEESFNIDPFKIITYLPEKGLHLGFSTDLSVHFKINNYKIKN